MILISRGYFLSQVSRNNETNHEEKFEQQSLEIIKYSNTYLDRLRFPSFYLLLIQFSKIWIKRFTFVFNINIRHKLIYINIYNPHCEMIHLT